MKHGPKRSGVASDAHSLSGIGARTPIPQMGEHANGEHVARDEENRPMKTRAAVAFEAKRPLEIVEVELDGPRAGEVLVEIMATGICHTDAYTLDGLDSEGLFPSI